MKLPVPLSTILIRTLWVVICLMCVGVYWREKGDIWSVVVFVGTTIAFAVSEKYFRNDTLI